MINANSPIVTAALTPAVLKSITPKQATNSTPVTSTNYGLDTTSCQAALSGLVVSVNGQKGVSVDGILALLVANMQYIFTNLKAAGITGFTTY